MHHPPNSELRTAWSEVMAEIGATKESTMFVQRWFRETIRMQEVKGPMTTWNFHVAIPDGGYLTADQQIEASR